MCNGYVQSAFLLIIEKSSYLEDFFSALHIEVLLFRLGKKMKKVKIKLETIALYVTSH